MSDQLTEGLHYDVPADVYHADPCPEASLSSSVAKTLLTRSPLHAAAMHPKINRDLEFKDDSKFDLGTAAHAYILEGERVFGIVEAADWRTKQAKAERDAHRADGLIPILESQYERVEAMARAVREQVGRLDLDPLIFGQGKSEVTAVWQEHNGVWCRARFDWLHDSLLMVDDLKTTSSPARPDTFIRRVLFPLGYDVQAAFYARGLKQITGADDWPGFRFIVVEDTFPYAVSVVSLGPEADSHAHDKVEQAIQAWGQCLESGVWPAYPTSVAFADLPPWVLTQWMEQEEAGRE